ncbi:hypothetical protein KBY23_16430 [Ruegeria pomeroyi]|nr:hypothetical protein [Ruegeria pomeroyi]
MTEIRDGFFYHPDGNSPTAELERLLAGEHNPAFDDLFSTTTHEVDAEIIEVERTRQKLLTQLVDLRKKLLSLRATRDEIEQAVQRFAETGEIAEVLIPACDAIVAKEQAAQRKADAPAKEAEITQAKAALTEKLPEGWDVTKTTADDEFVYVTVKCRRAVAAPEHPSREETRTRLVERVKQALEVYRHDFLSHAQSLRLAAVPANPRASP